MSIAFENECDKEFKCVDSLDEIVIPKEIVRQIAEVFYENWKREQQHNSEE